jgi:hypothetical protein
MLEVKKRVSRKEKEEKILKEIRRNKQPVDAEHIAKALKIGWGTASRTMLRMTVQGKLTALETTKGFVFMLPVDITPKKIPLLPT